jgi:hypothetical protein
MQTEGLAQEVVVVLLLAAQSVQANQLTLLAGCLTAAAVAAR